MWAQQAHDKHEPAKVNDSVPGSNCHVLEPRAGCSIVLAEQLTVADVTVNHGQAAVAGLVHDGAFGHSACSR